MMDSTAAARDRVELAAVATTKHTVYGLGTTVILSTGSALCAGLRGVAFLKSGFWAFLHLQ